MLKLANHLRPYRLAVGLVLVLTFAQSLASLYLPQLLSGIVDQGIVHGNVGYILQTGLWMLLVTLLGGLASVVASLYAARTTAGFGRDVRYRLFTHVESFSVHEFDRWGTSSLIVRTTNDVMQVQQLIYMLLRMAVMAPLTALGGIILAIYTAGRLSLVLVVVLPVMALAIYGVMGRGFSLFRVIQTKVDVLNRALREYLTGVRVIRSFGRTDHELRRFDGANADLTDTSVRVFELMATMMPLVMLIMNLATLAVVWFGARQIGGGTLQVGQLIAFIQYVTQILFAVMMVSMVLFMWPRGEASAQRIAEVLSVAPTISDPAQPLLPAEQRGRITFEDVTFRYPGAEEAAVAGVSCTVEPGRVTAIIGGTGSGKSTLLGLILRFFDATSGRVLVDGVDVRALTQHELRRRIGYVPQRAVLFTGSVAENVRFGEREASLAAVRRSLDIAQALEFVQELGGGDAEAGLNAEISQGGANLSGGQRQRLAIARALVRPAEIYVFDESFSALDYRTDARLRTALRRELGSATVLVVAQRVSTVKDADQILVMDEGRVVGLGTHAGLMETCPVYQEIVASQYSPEEIA